MIPRAGYCLDLMRELRYTRTMTDKGTVLVLGGVAGVGLLLTGLVFALNLAYAEELYVTRLIAGIINCF